MSHEKVVCRLAWMKKSDHSKNGVGDWIPYDTHYQFLLKVIKDYVRTFPENFYYVQYSTISVYKEHSSRWNFRVILSECNL